MCEDRCRLVEKFYEQVKDNRGEVDIKHLEKIMNPSIHPEVKILM